MNSTADWRLDMEISPLAAPLQPLYRCCFYTGALTLPIHEHYTVCYYSSGCIGG